MTEKLAHGIWLKRAANELKTSDGIAIIEYELVIDTGNDPTLRAWAKHFREHYCLDVQIDALRSGTGLNRADYLRNLIFPDKSKDFGPATRSGDFAEILVADLLQSQFDIWTPRTRYDTKMVRNESPKGSDILGFKLEKLGGVQPSKADQLISFESKAQLSGAKAKARLQDAVVDSAKDVFRIAESLNAMKRRLLDRNQFDDAKRVERFQDGLEVPYLRMSGAAAVFCSSVFDASYISVSTNCTAHENRSKLMLIVVHAPTLMNFVHALYERAADEA